MAPVDPESDPRLRLKLLQAEENALPDVPDVRRGARFAPCGCLFFGAMGLPLLKTGTTWSTILLIAVFAVIGALLVGVAAAYRPEKR